MASRDATGRADAADADGGAPPTLPPALRRGWQVVLLAALVGLPLAWISRHSLAGWGTVQLPYDLTVFLDAADDVIAGRTPFPAPAALTGDANYVYPPLLAIAMIPLAVLPVAAAVLIWTLLSAAAIAGALWLLGVRDWRVYGIAVLLVGTRDSIAAGTVGPLLVLGAAAAWRWRDASPVRAAAGTGLATALKLFVWPLLLWLAVTGRVRTALLALAFGAGAALASWAVVGFDGLGDYPDLLRRLSDLEAEESYSVYAVGRSIGLASAPAVVLSVVVGIVLLAYMVWVARTSSLLPVERDRLALTAAVTASLVLTPILWMHYLVLLLVPLALARPRLSLLWLVALVPAAVEVVGWSPAGWPSGDPASLAVVLGSTAIVLVALLRPSPSTA